MSSARPPVRVVVFGRHSADWMQALEPAAPVWKLMPEVAAVTLLDEAEPPPAAAAFGDDPPVLIPLMDAHAKARPWGFREFAPSPAIVDILANKRRFAEYVKRSRLGVFAPATFERPEDVRFPVVLKRADLSAGFGIVVVRDRRQMEQLLASSDWQGADYVLQEFVDDQIEFVTHCVCRAGTILWSCSMLYELFSDNPIRGTVPLRAVRQVGTPGHVLRQIEEFLLPLGYTGPCNVDYKLRASGEICVLEINPRLGGSLMMPRNVQLLRESLGVIIENAAVSGA